MTQQQELSLDFDKALVPGSVKKAMHEVKASSSDLWKVKIGDIRVIDNFNVRVRDDEYYAHIRMLADSMRAHGFKVEKPLGGYVSREGDRNIIYVHDGHCRLEAVALANSEGAQIEQVPVIVGTAGQSLEDLTVGLVTSNNGRPLKPFEVGVVCKRLAGYGWEEERIAVELGYTTQYVNDLLLLMASPRQIRDMVQAGQVAATKAVEMLRKHGDKALDILEHSLRQAQAAGKNKVTNKFVPGAALKKAVTKNASTMMTTLRDVRSDPGYRSLATETRLKLDELLRLLDAAEKDGTLPGMVVDAAGGETEAE